jgi:hypothetical protein
LDQFDISTGLDECGTKMSVDGDEIVFDNTISVKSRVNNHGIVMNSNVNIDVQERVIPKLNFSQGFSIGISGLVPLLFHHLRRFVV